MNTKAMTSERPSRPAPQVEPHAPVTKLRGGIRSNRGALWQVVAAVAAVLLWWWGSIAAPTATVSSPVETVVELWNMLLTPAFWEALGNTVGTFAIGVSVCVVVGIPLGLAIGVSTIASASTRLVFDFLRTIPSIAILPLLVLLFGPTNTMVLVMAIAGALWPIVIQSVYAARQTEPQLLDMAGAFGIRGWWRTSRIFIPSVVPFVMTGVRISSTVCLLLTISGELLGGAPGVGRQLMLAQSGLNNPRMYAYVLVSAILGVLVNSLLWRLQRKLLRWHPSFRGEVHE